MASTLVISADRYVFHVEWIDAGEPGAWVGQDASASLDSLRSQAAKAKQRRDEVGWAEFEYLAVEIAAKEWAKKNGKDNDVFLRRAGGYEFESMAAAKRFLAAMKSAAKAARHEYDTGVAWPGWAKQAHAAGWRPPKNWKP